LPSSLGDGSVCTVCGVHSIPFAMVKLMFANADDCKTFETSFEASPCEVKQQFWDCFHEQFYDLYPLLGNASGPRMSNGE